jgi:hypothetical protein
MLENFSMLPNGVIKQDIITEKFEYDVNYVKERYDSKAYEDNVKKMSYLRLGYIIGSIGYVPQSILDVGYGNGDFLKACSNIILNCYGNDVNDYPLPWEVSFVKNIMAAEYEVITFFDSLEHFEDILFVKGLKCKYIGISVPNCHYFSDEWFKEWKHRRENEHLYHFNEKSLIKFMDECGFDMINISNIEDSIRKNNEDYTNILTGFFKKR